MRRVFTFLLSILLVLTVTHNNQSVNGEELDITDTTKNTERFSLSSDDNNFKVPHGDKIVIDFEIPEDYGNVNDNVFDTTVKLGDILVDSAKIIESSILKNDDSGNRIESKKFRLDTTCEGVIGENEINIEHRCLGNLDNTPVYIYCSEEYDYVSLDSTSKVKSIYYSDTYGVDEGIEYQTFVFGNDAVTETNDLLQGILDSDEVGIQGYIKYEDKNNTENPAENIKVMIYDKDLVFDDHLATVYTDVNGFYSYTTQNDTSENGLDLYIKIVYETDEYIVWQNYPFTKYNYTTGHESDINGGDIVLKGLIFNYDVNNDMTAGMHQHQAMNVGFKYLDHVDNSSSYDVLDVLYPVGSQSYYLMSTIVIELSDGYNWDIHTHEFGHYADDQMYLFLWFGGDHARDKNMMDVYYLDNYSNAKEEGARVALAEGFATYFGTMARERYASHLSIDGVADGEYRGNPIESHSSWRLGEGNEWTISRLFYDLVDSNQEPHDNIDISEQSLIQLLKDSNGAIGASNFTHFWQEFLDSSYYGDTGPLLEYYNISPVITSLSSGFQSTYSPMSLVWDNQGGSVYFPNENPVINVKDNNGSEILNVTLSGNVTSYTFNINQWNYILNNSDEYFYVSIEVEQSDSPETGPYESSDYLIYLPPVTNAFAYTNYYDDISYPLDFQWFEFTAPSSGYYEFYTLGNTDTFGEFFYDLVADVSIQGRVYYNDNSGMNENFKKVIYLSSGQKIYIRIRGGTSTETGEYTFRVIIPGNC